MTRCLILSCSQAKRSDATLLPALERYDGPPFRVVRRFLAEADPTLRDVDVYVLSARYGLIAGATFIADYDLRMTPTRAVELRPQVMERLREILRQGYSECFLSLGLAYLQAIDGFEALAPAGVQITVSRSAMGKRLTELRRWLYRQSPMAQPVRQLHKPARPTGRAVLKGRSIKATPDEALELARQAMAESRGDPHNFHTWYALVDGERVGAKWLVSLLSGLGVSEFQASEARRVLGQLGIEVYRND